MQNGRVGGQARVHRRGGRERGPCPPPPPLEMGKKMLSEEILTSFAYVLLMTLGGIDIHCIHATWKGVGGQALVHGRRGWGRGRLAPPLLENEKKKLSEEILTSFTYVLLMKLGGGGIDTLYMQNGRGWADRRLSMVGGGGAEGALPPLENEKERRISAN